MNRTAGVLAVLLALAGCGEKVEISVACKTTAVPSVECVVTQNKGKSEVEVCWDFAVVCANGTKLTPPRSCTKVKGGGASNYTIGPEKLQGAEKCDKEPKATVSNITMNGKS